MSEKLLPQFLEFKLIEKNLHTHIKNKTQRDKSNEKNRKILLRRFHLYHLDYLF